MTMRWLLYNERSVYLTLAAHHHVYSQIPSHWIHTVTNLAHKVHISTPWGVFQPGTLYANTVLKNHVPSVRALSGSKLGTSWLEGMCPSNLYYKQNLYNIFQAFVNIFRSRKIYKITIKSIMFTMIINHIFFLFYCV